MHHHPFHIHGYRFKATATDGERISASAQWLETSVLVAVGQTHEIEFTADAPGNWIVHCHMAHHTMTQMGHGLTNMIDMDMPENSRHMEGVPLQYGKGTMGGLFTIFKVREKLSNYQGPGWYEHPDGTVERIAKSAELRADDIKV